MNLQTSAQSENLGKQLARLRQAYGVKQQDAASRAGLSRSTAYRLECGDHAVGLGEVLRYLEAIAPACTLQDLLGGMDPAMQAMDAQAETRHRVRDGATVYAITRPLA
ncbi:MAG: helix-turn-helix transcriptional regulator [Pseudomonadota bacterium]